MLDFARDASIQVRPKFDTESTKTVGLTQQIMAEAERPICDLFWNNEILNTLRLKKRGLLVPFTPPSGQAMPAAFRAQDNTWYGFAARARILLVNTDLVPPDQRPTRLEDLLDPAWRGQAAMAKPLFGTTATHAACLFASWGSERARTFFQDLKANDIQILSGNKQVAQAVGSGQAAFGLTDTDDALGEIRAGRAVLIVYPDQQEGGLGTLFIPNTVAVIRRRPESGGSCEAGRLPFQSRGRSPPGPGPERPDSAEPVRRGPGPGRDTANHPPHVHRLRGRRRFLGRSGAVSPRTLRRPVKHPQELVRPIP